VAPPNPTAPEVAVPNPDVLDVLPNPPVLAPNEGVALDDAPKPPNVLLVAGVVDEPNVKAIVYI
jgi:hypothetical protein